MLNEMALDNHKLYRVSRADEFFVHASMHYFVGQRLATQRDNLGYNCKQFPFNLFIFLFSLCVNAPYHTPTTM